MRALLGAISRTTWETVSARMAEAAGEREVWPGMGGVSQTFGSLVNAHPHIHAIVSRGGWQVRRECEAQLKSAGRNAMPVFATGHAHFPFDRAVEALAQGSSSRR